jgi:hypothetical protein
MTSQHYYKHKNDLFISIAWRHIKKHEKCYYFAVKKFFFIFLIVLLPLQFSWAAAAVYCQHEEVPTGFHLGHHSHQHDAETDSSNKAGNQLAEHSDCGYCHLASQPPFAMDVPVVALPTAWIGNFMPASSFSSHIPDRLNEPDWRLAA